jgi:hypothetical protein
VIVTQAAMNENFSFVEGWLISTVISFALKYSSIISGQMLGQCLGKVSVGIRKQVCVFGTFGWELFYCSFLVLFWILSLSIINISRE